MNIHVRAREDKSCVTLFPASAGRGENPVRPSVRPSEEVGPMKKYRVYYYG